MYEKSERNFLGNHLAYQLTQQAFQMQDKTLHKYTNTHTQA